MLDFNLDVCGRRGIVGLWYEINGLNSEVDVFSYLYHRAYLIDGCVTVSDGCIDTIS